MNSEERRQKRSVRDRLRTFVPLAVMWTIGGGLIAIVATRPRETAGELLMDPSFTMGETWYTGLVSNLGVLAWTVGAAAAFAGAWLCDLGLRTRARRFLLAGGVVGTVLLLDDLLQLHAVLLPTELRTPKIVGELALVVLVAWWVGTHLAELRRTHAHLLLAAGAALGASLVVDTVYSPLPGAGWNVIEDGAKLLGILAWAAYFVVTARDISRSVFRSALTTPVTMPIIVPEGAVPRVDLGNPRDGVDPGISVAAPAVEKPRRSEARGALSDRDVGYVVEPTRPEGARRR
ncbi:MAG: hypothetical protein R2698_12565 [Microthrixaceae bacterium]